MDYFYYEQQPSNVNNHHQQQHPSSTDHQYDIVASTRNKTIIMASVPASAAAKNDKATSAKAITRGNRIELIQPDKDFIIIIYFNAMHIETSPTTIEASDTNSKHDPAAATHRFQYLKEP